MPAESESWDVKVVSLGLVSGTDEHEAILRGLTTAGWRLVAVTTLGPSARAYLIKPR